jgi:hypothetical protein
MQIKVVRYWVLAIAFLIPNYIGSAETAQARIWCWSLHFQQGSDGSGDTLDLTTISGTPNGELAPYNGLQYVSNFLLDSLGTPIPGTMYLNLPPFTDDNTNGWPDFFEVTQAVTAATSGTYSTQISTGTITATWNRGAGSKDGTCVLHVVDNVFGDLGQFQHTFELLEYTGPLTYTPGTNIVIAFVNLTKSGDPSSQLQGPLQFIKLPTDPLNQLNLQAGAWTNAQSQTLAFSTNLFLRDQAGWPTNYYGFMDFADGDPTTSAPDYLTWTLSIDDVNDSNHNGIPDFSDFPQTVTVPQPLLSLSLTTTNLQLAISANIGTICQLQQATSLPATWQLVQTITITNNPQSLSLPLPTAPTAFWRVQVQ